MLQARNLRLKARLMFMRTSHFALGLPHTAVQGLFSKLLEQLIFRTRVVIVVVRTHIQVHALGMEAGARVTMLALALHSTTARESIDREKTSLVADQRRRRVRPMTCHVIKRRDDAVVPGCPRALLLTRCLWPLSCVALGLACPVVRVFVHAVA